MPLSETPELSILDRVSTIHERPPRLKVLLYGNPGVGKTVFAAGAPNPLFVDTENGTLSLLNHPEFTKTKVLPLKSFRDIEDLFWELKAGGMPEIQSIVIDTISELQRRQLDELLKKAHEKDRNRNPYLPFQQDYKENTEILRRLVVSFRDLDRNLIVTAHAVEQTDESDGRIYWRPAVTPKLASTLEGIMDVVGFLSLDVDQKTNEKTRYLQVHPTRRVTAKTRLGGLETVIVNPTFQTLINANSGTPVPQAQTEKS